MVHVRLIGMIYPRGRSVIARGMTVGFSTVSWPWDVLQKLLDFFEGHALFHALLALVGWRTARARPDARQLQLHVREAVPSLNMYDITIQ